MAVGSGWLVDFRMGMAGFLIFVVRILLIEFLGLYVTGPFQKALTCYIAVTISHA